MVKRGVFSQQSPHEEAIVVAVEPVAVDVLDHVIDEVPCAEILGTAVKIAVDCTVGDLDCGADGETRDSVKLVTDALEAGLKFHG